MGIDMGAVALKLTEWCGRCDWDREVRAGRQCASGLPRIYMAHSSMMMKLVPRVTP
jgi:hypothetical protein